MGKHTGAEPEPFEWAGIREDHARYMIVPCNSSACRYVGRHR